MLEQQNKYAGSILSSKTFLVKLRDLIKGTVMKIEKKTLINGRLGVSKVS